MDWQNIGEGIIASLIAMLIGSICTFVYSRFIYSSKKEIKRNFVFPKDPFVIMLFLTIIFGVFTGCSFYFQWPRFNELAIIESMFIFLTLVIFNTQCPKCKKIFSRRYEGKNLLNKEEKAHYYRDKTNYYYSDGTLKNSKYDGPEKKRMETIETYRDKYFCKSCGHKWESDVKRKNLDAYSRPKAQRYNTRHKNPNNNLI